MRRRLRRALVPVLALLATAFAFQAPTADAVVGGTEVPQGKYPWMVAFLKDGQPYCGGSVIADRWVLTAAHCVDRKGKTKGLSVSVGNVDWTKGTRIAVIRVIQHPAYNEDNMANDVALLELAAPAGVPALALNHEATGDSYEETGDPVTVAGWGSEAPIVGLVPPMHNRMQEADLRVVSDRDCSQDDDAPTQVCAEAFLADSCQGDSGGPLFTSTPTGYLQIGVVSYGFGCAVPEFPGVYAEVNAAGPGSIRQFIRTNAGV